MKHTLSFTTSDTLPCVVKGSWDTGPARPHDLDAIAWGALIAAELINGCGPEHWGALVPDLTPQMRAAGHRHDLDCLIGGTPADRDKADSRFAALAPALYAVAVHKFGDKWFSHRDKPLSHGELCIIVQAAYWKAGYAASSSLMPFPATLAHLERP